MFIAAGVFVVILSAIFGAYWVLIARPEEAEERALRKRLKTRRVSNLGPTIVKAAESLSSLGPLNAMLARSQRVTGPLRVLVARSGYRITVGTVALSIVFLFFAGFTMVNLVVASISIGVIAGLVCASLPILFLRWAAAKRLARFEEQFPEAMDLIARALRAGHALPTALQMTGDEIADPVGTEFKQLFEQQNFGMSLPDALKAMADRVPILDARFFVTALLTQREMGGNLSEVLDNLAAVIRERFKIKRQVRAVSAHGRITGWVLAALPPTVAGLLVLIAPSHIRLLVDDPLGLDMVMGAVVLQVIGMLVIRRIVAVEY